MRVNADKHHAGDGSRAAARFVLLGLLLVSPWPNALNAPVFFGVLFALSPLFLLSSLRRRVGEASLPAPRRFQIAVLLYAAALFWGVLQVAPIWPTGLAHPVWAAVATSPAPISASPGRSFDSLMLLTAYGAVFAFTAIEATDRRFARRVLAVVGATCVLSALAGMFLFAAGDVALSGASKNAYWGRLTGPFVNPNLFASYLALGLMVLAVFAASCAPSERSGRLVWIWRAEAFLRSKAALLAGVVVLFSALLLTASRGGAIAVLAGVGALAMCLFAVGRRRGPGVAAVVAAGLIAAIAAGTSGGGLQERLSGSALRSEGRQEVYRFTASMIEDRPLAGHGLGAFQDALPAYYDGEGALLRKPFLYAHNLYTESAVELGAPGAILLFSAVGLIIVQCVAGVIRRRSRDRVFPTIALASATVMGVHGLVDNPLILPAVAISFAAILGVGYGQSLSRRDTTRVESGAA